MPDPLEPYRTALARVAETARGAAQDQLGCALPSVQVLVVSASPGDELLAAVPPDTVHLAVSDPRQLRPPPAGGNTIYGVCHEIGHLVTAWTTPRWRDLPVVWDEAFAHLLAVDVFLPAVWVAHGPTLWPDPYPDYLDREVELPDEPAGWLHGSVATLQRSTSHLRGIADAVGLDRLLAALRVVPPHQLRVAELGRALQKAADGSDT